MRLRRPLAVLLTLLLVFALPAVALAGSSPPPAPAAKSATAASTVKFIFHAGLAFGAFREFIYKPFRAGTFTKGGFLHKLAAYAKAGVAGLFVFHEVKLALADAKSSKLLSHLVSPLTALVAVFATVVKAIKAHNLGGSAGVLNGASSSVSSVEQTASKSGSSISEKVPSASQLLAGVAP